MASSSFFIIPLTAGAEFCNSVGSESMATNFHVECGSLRCGGLVIHKENTGLFRVAASARCLNVAAG